MALSHDCIGVSGVGGEVDAVGGRVGVCDEVSAYWGEEWLFKENLA